MTVGNYGVSLCFSLFKLALLLLIRLLWSVAIHKRYSKLAVTPAFAFFSVPPQTKRSRLTENRISDTVLVDVSAFTVSVHVHGIIMPYIPAPTWFSRVKCDWALFDERSNV